MQACELTLERRQRDAYRSMQHNDAYDVKRDVLWSVEKLACAALPRIKSVPGAEISEENEVRGIQQILLSPASEGSVPVLLVVTDSYLHHAEVPPGLSGAGR